MTLHLGDCVEVMAQMPANSVDAIVCDPPYGLSFMGKAWDSFGVSAHQGGTYEGRATYNDVPRTVVSGYMQKGRRGLSIDESAKTNLAQQEWHQRWAREALRVAKPGAYLLAFGGTRTYHRLACAIEDAGWIIRDCLVWAYASGFPKSKALLKPAWEPIVMARKPGPLRELAIDACRIPTNGEEWSYNADRNGTTFHGEQGARIKQTAAKRGADTIENNPLGRWPANVVLTDPIFDGGIDGVVGGGEAGGAGPALRTLTDNASRESDFHMGESTRQIGGDTGTYSRFFLIPKADRAEREPVFGGLEVQHAGVGIRAAEPGEYEDFVYPAPEGIGAWLREQRKAAGIKQKDIAAHFPSASGGLTGCVANWELELNRPTPEQWRTLRQVIGFDDRYDEVMTAMRDVPRALLDGKATAKRRNHHPTVKPLDLMRHLVRLVTPPSGTVLDPFLGSGTTAIAAEMEGFAWIGIEREAEYVAIAEARLQGVQRGLGLAG